MIDNKAWAPSAVVAWDATHDGRTVVRGGYSQYVDVAIRTPVIHTLGSPNQNFGAETGWMAPFRVRLGMDYKF